MRPLKLIFCYIALLLPVNVLAQLELTYIGNEGFMISDGQHKILIDALYGNGLKGYVVVPKATRDSLEAGLGKYGGRIDQTGRRFGHMEPAITAGHSTTPGNISMQPATAQAVGPFLPLQG